MKRNIVQQGPSTLMVSIPSKWVKKYNLKKGMQVEVEEKGRDLFISTHNLLESKKKEISLLHSNHYYIWRELVAAYVSGYDEITVKYSNVESYEFIEQHVLPAFIGFEIVEHKTDYCVLKKIAHEEIQDFQIIMRRIFLTLLHASEQFLHILKTSQDINTIEPLERTNNRQTYYLTRLLTKEGYEKQDKTTFASTLVFLLEQLMNQYKYCAWAIKRQKANKVKSKIIEYYEQVHKKLEQLYELYFSYSQVKFEQFRNRTTNIDSRTGEGIDLIKEYPIVMYYILSMIEKMNYASYQIQGIQN